MYNTNIRVKAYSTIATPHGFNSYSYTYSQAREAHQLKDTWRTLTAR